MMVGKTNLKILIYDSDFYGLYAINSYLAWDRRTRVVGMAHTVDDIFDWVDEHIEAEWPDVALLDTYGFTTPRDMAMLVYQVRERIPDVQVIVLEREPSLDMALAILNAGAGAYFMRDDVGLQIAWAIVWAQQPEFAISKSIQDVIPEDIDDERLAKSILLPEKRHYPELTDRIREAIQLCVVEGMSADLAADEMGVSTHTIRSYVKEGYRILESYDEDQEYPAEMSAQERAFMRFTALQDEVQVEEVIEQDAEQDVEDETEADAWEGGD